MAGAPSEEGTGDVFLRLRADVILYKVEVACVQIEEEVPVSSQKCPAVEVAAESAAGVSEGLLDMVEGLKYVEDLWVLVEKLPGEGGAATGGRKEQDVFPR